MSKKHSFTKDIFEIMKVHFIESSETIYNLSPLLQYLNNKTRSANRGSKSRSSFANLYAIYVLVEDYLKIMNEEKIVYSDYSGADYSPLLFRIRSLPFGSKLQNHALNSRANDEFHKFFPDLEERPIIRDVALQKYWINENLLKVKVVDKVFNIANVVLEIIEKYVKTKKESFNQFIEDCNKILSLREEFVYDIVAYNNTAYNFISELLKPEKDARIFEIVSYAILKNYYFEDIVFIGKDKFSVLPENLKLYKTGRTNANDGGIDFVMKPLGRFFQVTETLDVKKYFLDIDKIEHYPITFVIKTTMKKEDIIKKLEDGAREQYPVEEIVKKYMAAIEQIITIEDLLTILRELLNKNIMAGIMNEIMIWSKLEFNYTENNDSDSVVDSDEDENE